MGRTYTRAMAKRKRGGGRVTPKGTRPVGYTPKQKVDQSQC